MTDTARITIDFEVQEPHWEAVTPGDPRIETTRVHLTGVRDSAIVAARRSFDADAFSVQSQSPQLWRYAGSGAIHCDAPISDPVVFLLELSDWIYEQGAPKDLRFYCGEGSFASLAHRLSQAMYPLIAGPIVIVDEAARRLARLGVPHRVESHPRTSPVSIVVQFGDSWVVCESAVVEALDAAG